MAAGVLIMFSNLLTIFSAFKFIGELVLTVYRMLTRDILRFLIVYVTLLYGFATALHVLIYDATYEGEYNESPNQVTTYVCMYVCMYVCVCVCMHVRLLSDHVCMYVSMCIHTCICLCIKYCMCTCMCVHTCIRMCKSLDVYENYTHMKLACVHEYVHTACMYVL